MTLFMGMAHSTPQEKHGKLSSLKSAVNGGTETGSRPTSSPRKLGFVSRLRKKLLFYHREGNNNNKQASAPTTTSTSTSTNLKTTSALQNEAAPPPDNASPLTALPSTPRRVGPRGVVPFLPRPPTLKRIESEQRDRLKPVEQTRQERRDRGIDPKSSLKDLRPIQSQSITSISDLQEIRALEAAARRKNSEKEASLNPQQEEGQQLKTQEKQQPKNEEEQQPKDEEKQQTLKLEKNRRMSAEEKEEENKEKQKGEEAKHEPNLMEFDGKAGEQEVEKNGDINALRLEDGEVPLVIDADESGLSVTTEDDWQKEPPLVSKEIEDEMEWRWILNLSMHFRDESNREKFFVTFAQEKGVRRRLTISCDYRDAEEGTLEKELSGLRYQRDKSAKIYEAIRDSLQDIMFYETITNLKLQTSEGRLHVHVTEDLNEIIPYPPVSAIAHLRCPKYRESELEFDSHLSGFVYKISVQGKIMIKKEIPGPDTVDEFLYEINALYALADSENVIRFGGCVVDDQRQKVKGLLISFASRGALIDILYNERGKLPWSVREKWAKQIVSGLSEIHEAGYVQGDFTLSNIVIDGSDDAKIIDINRRGCPVGWEPPEVTAMIDGLQRIGMYIGVKSDIFQLGMVLWGLAHERDEPETISRPLTMDRAPDDVPTYFRELVEACLCDKPQGRPSAKDMIAMFPERIDDAPYMVHSSTGSDGRPLPGISYWSQQTNGYFPEISILNGDTSLLQEVIFL
jgi:serine/threonine protein kinase